MCPSGVPYGHLLEATRATLTERHPLPFAARALLGVFARPRLMSFSYLEFWQPSRTLLVHAFDVLSARDARVSLGDAKTRNPAIAVKDIVRATYDVITGSVPR